MSAVPCFWLPSLPLLYRQSSRKPSSLRWVRCCQHMECCRPLTHLCQNLLLLPVSTLPPTTSLCSPPDGGPAALVVGGSVNEVLKLARRLRNPPQQGKAQQQRKPQQQALDGGPPAAHLLVIDEASMMPFPHALAVATAALQPARVPQPQGRAPLPLLTHWGLVPQGQHGSSGPQGMLLLGGDHRQLSPILAHDFEAELRPSLLRVPAYLSVYDYVWRVLGARGAPLYAGPVATGALVVSHASRA